MVWGVSIPVAEFRTSQQVKNQILNFSPDNRYLIIATQKYDKFRGRDDDTVWLRVWRCEENAGEGTAMGDCQMPTVFYFCPVAFYYLVANFFKQRTTLELRQSSSTQPSTKRSSVVLSIHHIPYFTTLPAIRDSPHHTMRPRIGIPPQSLLQE